MRGRYPMTITLYGIPNCDTVRKARAWLAERHIEAEFHDFKKAGVPSKALDQWIDALGHDALLNRRGTTWRRLDDDLRSKAEAGAKGARALMLAEPGVIRRPVIDWHGRFTVGFDPVQWPPT